MPTEAAAHTVGGTSVDHRHGGAPACVHGPRFRSLERATRYSARPVRRSLSFATVASALVFAANASAAPTGRLVYSRARDAESCPDEGTLRRAVAARVGYDPFFPWAQRTVVASVERVNRQFVANVSLIDEQGIAHGARQLRTSGDCAELLDAAALAIAIAIDPELLARPPAAPPPEPGPPIAPYVVSTPPAAPPPAETFRSPRPLPATRHAVFETTFGVLAAAGDAPDIAAGLDIGAQVRWRNVSIAVEGRVDAPATRAAKGGGDVSSWLALGAVVPCAYFGPFLACAVAEGGGVRVSSSGVPDRRAQWTGAWEAGGRVGVLVPVARGAFLRVRSDLLYNLDPTELELRGMPVWTATRFTSALGIDVVLRFR